MEVNEIRKILSGLKVPVAVKRQAWIDYGGLLAKCPHKQGAKIGAWIREQGLDFVEDRIERSASLKLFNCRDIPTVKLEECPYSRPTDVLKWLREQGLIDFEEKPPAVTPDPPTKWSIGESRFENLTTELKNACNWFAREHIDDLVEVEKSGEDPSIILVMDRVPASPYFHFFEGQGIELEFSVVVKPIRINVSESHDGNVVKADNPSLKGTFADFKFASESNGILPENFKKAMFLIDGIERKDDESS
jgi:hypothetical protein